MDRIAHATTQQQEPGPIAVTAHTHRDKRVNIPTEELRDFVADDEKAPATMLYSRDPSLDPQRVWIHPQAIIEHERNWTNRMIPSLHSGHSCSAAAMEVGEDHDPGRTEAAGRA